MNTDVSLAHDLALLAQRPGGWMLPLVVLVLLALGIWALFDVALADRVDRLLGRNR